MNFFERFYVLTYVGRIRLKVWENSRGDRFMKHAIVASWLALACLSLAAVPAAEAGPRILQGQVSQERVENLTNQIQWYHSLPQAEAEARREGKMIFWVHMLGSLDGAT